jgi:hypothetical protein
MKFTIGYSIYNKAHMMDDIIDGLSSNIREDADYIFIFDGCTDGSEEVFDSLSHNLNGNISKYKTDNIFQLKSNNMMMDKFKTEFLIIFQDDMVLQDQNFLSNIIKIYDIYNERLGIIGCRDGYEKSYSNMIGSPHSESNREILEIGKFEERSMINIGPIILRKTLIEKVGKFDESYGVGGYEETEYALKCKYEHNLVNIILSIDIIHSKFEHKNKNKTKHTSGDLLSNQITQNNQLFRSRWYNLSGI